MSSLSESLIRRRRELKMSVPLLARRSGVSIATVNRVLSGKGASTENLLAIAEALGLQLDLTPVCDSLEFREREAERKARILVCQLQGTSSLEAQGLGRNDFDRLVRQAVHELMSGPSRRIWSP